MGNVTALRPDDGVEYDPATFLHLVQSEMDDHDGEFVAVLALVLDSEGNYSAHCSTPDRERRLAMLSMAHAFAVEDMRKTLSYGFAREPVFEPDSP